MSELYLRYVFKLQENEKMTREQNLKLLSLVFEKWWGILYDVCWRTLK